MRGSSRSGLLYPDVGRATVPCFLTSHSEYYVWNVKKYGAALRFEGAGSMEEAVGPRGRSFEGRIEMEERTERRITMSIGGPRRGCIEEALGTRRRVTAATAMEDCINRIFLGLAARGQK
ncbi:hypothetical protein KM043_014868 [Ampulex compressa]|nr:hypothetical protein KM043_014868 [Ampulex compressa]